MSGMKVMLNMLEQNEDMMIQAYMSDELDQQLGGISIAGNSWTQDSEDNETSEPVSGPQIARKLIDLQIEGLREGIVQGEAAVNKATCSCMGSITLRAVQDGVAYGATLCRSDSPADDIESPINTGRTDSLFEIALVTRNSLEPTEEEK